MICVLCFILDKCRLVSTCSTRRVLRYLFAASRMCHHSSGSSTFQLRQHVNRKIPIYGKSPLPSPPNVSVRFAENQECAGMLRYLTWKLSDCFPCGAHKEHNILVLILKMNIWHIYIYKYPEEWKYDETNCWSWILTISTKTICWNCQFQHSGVPARLDVGQPHFPKLGCFSCSIFFMINTLTKIFDNFNFYKKSSQMKYSLNFGNH